MNETDLKNLSIALEALATALHTAAASLRKPEENSQAKPIPTPAPIPASAPAPTPAPAVPAPALVPDPVIVPDVKEDAPVDMNVLKKRFVLGFKSHASELAQFLRSRGVDRVTHLDEAGKADLMGYLDALGVE